jgi:hypothetical protein
MTYSQYILDSTWELAMWPHVQNRGLARQSGALCLFGGFTSARLTNVNLRLEQIHLRVPFSLDLAGMVEEEWPGSLADIQTLLLKRS